MSFTGLPRGRRKAISTVRILHNGGGSSVLYKDGVSIGAVTYNDTSWLEIFAATAQVVNFIEIFDSVGETSRVGTGAAASEVDLFQIPPGGNGFIPVQIEAGTRLTLRAITVPTPNTETVINFYD